MKDENAKRIGHRAQGRGQRKDRKMGGWEDEKIGSSKLKAERSKRTG